MSTSSVENYLEAILVLSKKRPVVRSIDIANYLGYSKSSVSIAVKHLREQELAYMTDEGFLYLTEKGNAIAVSIYDRHSFFAHWLTSLGVDKDTAEEDACKMEHAISAKSFSAIKKAIESQEK